jgi:hypothetical protein
VLVNNPKVFYPKVFEERKLSDQVSWGHKEEDLYPHLIFSGNPFTRAHIQMIDEWLIENRETLPLSLKQLSFQDVVLLIRFSRYFKNVLWQLYHQPTDLILGGGLLVMSHDGKYFDTASTFIDFHGFGIYPVVIQKLKYEMGPLRSDTSVNLNASKVWARLGAQFDGKRWVLD